MDYKHEQTVSAAPDKRSSLLLVLAGVGVALLALLAIVFAAGILGSDENGALSVNWIGAVCMLLCIGGAFCLWRLKDRFRIEYDYILTEGRLEVTAILNNRRRIPKLKLELGRILACGQGRPPQGRMERLYLDPSAKLTWISYEEKGDKRIALLELNGDMRALLKNSRDLQRGAWRDEYKA